MIQEGQSCTLAEQDKLLPALATGPACSKLSPLTTYKQWIEEARAAIRDWFVETFYRHGVRATSLRTSPSDNGA